MNLQDIRTAIEQLYKSDEQLHMNIRLRRPKLELENAPARIIGVYPNMFRIEESHTGVRRTHSLLYTDVLIGQIDIMELHR